jgi:hypothetical protein
VSGLLGHRERFGASEGGGPSGLRFYPALGLPLTCGWGVLLAGACGLVYGARRKERAVWMLGIYLLGFYLFLLGPLRVVHIRYVAPLLPAIIALASVGLVEVGARARRGPLGRWPALAPLLLGALVAAQPAAASFATGRILSRKDTRDLAYEWLAREHPSASISNVSDQFAAVHALERGVIRECAEHVPGGAEATAPRVRDTNTGWQDFVRRGVEMYDALATAAIWRYVQPEDGGELVVWSNPEVTCDGPPAAPRPGPPCFEKVQAFGPGGERCRAWFDRFDKFWVPASGFSNVERPGPAIEIYRNRCR